MAVGDGAQPATGQRRKGRIPTWGWVALAGGAVVLYYFWNKSQAAKAAAASSAQPAGAMAPVAAGSYGNAGDLASLLPYLQNMNGNASTSGGSGATYTPPSGEVLAGGGYQQAPGQTSVTSASGNSVFAPILNGQQLSAIAASGTPVYFQPQPGVFQPVPQGMSISGIPTFTLVAGSGQ